MPRRLTLMMTRFLTSSSSSEMYIFAVSPNKQIASPSCKLLVPPVKSLGSDCVSVLPCFGSCDLVWLSLRRSGVGLLRVVVRDTATFIWPSSGNRYAEMD